METLILLFVVGGVAAFIMHKTRLPGRKARSGSSVSATHGHAWHDADDPKAPHFDTTPPPGAGLGLATSAALSGVALCLSRDDLDAENDAGDCDGGDSGGGDSSD